MSVPSTQTSFYESPKKPLQNAPFQKVYVARVARSGSHSFPLQLKIVTDTQLLLPVRLPNYLNNGAVTRLPRRPMMASSATSILLPRFGADLGFAR